MFAIRVAICFMFCMSVYMDIIQTNNLELIKESIFNSINNSLVIFDIDQVILTPDDEILNNKSVAVKSFVNAALNKIKQNRSEQDLQNMISVMNLAAKEVLVTHKL